MVLGFPIEAVEVSKEKSIIYNPEYKGVRLDVYARDANRTCYNIEMQTLPKPAMEKRNRYYHSQMDMELLLSGRAYSELPNVYTIFLCDFDPFGEGKYCYSFQQQCREAESLRLNDGSCSIFLNTCGTNETEVSKELVQFLRFVRADLKESAADYEDTFVKKLQESIKHIKQNRRMEEKFMLFEDFLGEERAEARAEGRAEGKAEAIVDILGNLGTVPPDTAERILKERDLNILRKWLQCAVRAKNLEEFFSVM